MLRFTFQRMCLHFQSGRNVDVNIFPVNVESNIESNIDNVNMA